MNEKQLFRIKKIKDFLFPQPSLMENGGKEFNNLWKSKSKIIQTKNCESKNKEFTMEEIKKHSKDGDLWILVNG